MTNNTYNRLPLLSLSPICYIHLYLSEISCFIFEFNCVKYHKRQIKLPHFTHVWLFSSEKYHERQIMFPHFIYVWLFSSVKYNKRQMFPHFTYIWLFSNGNYHERHVSTLHICMAFLHCEIPWKTDVSTLHTCIAFFSENYLERQMFPHFTHAWIFFNGNYH